MGAACEKVKEEEERSEKKREPTVSSNAKIRKEPRCEPVTVKGAGLRPLV